MSSCRKIRFRAVQPIDLPHWAKFFSDGHRLHHFERKCTLTPNPLTPNPVASRSESWKRHAWNSSAKQEPRRSRGARPPPGASALALAGRFAAKGLLAVCGQACKRPQVAARVGGLGALTHPDKKPGQHNQNPKLLPTASILLNFSQKFNKYGITKFASAIIFQ